MVEARDRPAIKQGSKQETHILVPLEVVTWSDFYPFSFAKWTSVSNSDTAVITAVFQPKITTAVLV
jgi:hypothetical protein